MMEPVTLQDQDGIAVLTIYAPPVNALSLALVAKVREAVRQFAATPQFKALVVCGAGKHFVAGANAKEFSAADFDHRHFGVMMSEVEALDRPVIAALQGSVLGAGLELALASHWRVAAPGTRLGFPEVLLGLLPGAGGTQRLTRLVGPVMALDLVTTGRHIDAATAHQVGLVDEITTGDVVQAGVALAQRLVAQGAVRRRSRDRVSPKAAPSADFFALALADAQHRRAAYPAVQRIVQCIEAATKLSFDQGLDVESRMFDECRRSRESAALLHLFFAQREAAKIPGLGKHLPPHRIGRVGVVGSGTMGGGIAMNFANAGIPTLVVDNDAKALQRGLQRIRGNYEASAAKGRMTMQQVEQRMGLLQGVPTLEALADCDLVIEAVFENLDIKRDVCSKLGQVCKPGAIIGSNTSTLDINVLAEAIGHPADFLGLHFFSPANVMKLLEVVRGAKTSEQTLAAAMQVAKTIGKVAVVSGVCYGFIGNRMLESYLRESDFLLLEGATPAQIDKAIEGLGLAMGPCRMLDMAGTDVAGKIVLERAKAGSLPNDPAYRAVVVHLLESGRHGQKTGSGYYRYEGRQAQLDPTFALLCQELAERHGIVRRDDITDAEIVERCLYPLINEGALIVEEGIAYRASDVDVVWTQGYGFPDYRGGPLFMADQIGLGKIVAALDGYASRRGNEFGYWSVSPLLRQLAAKGKRLSDQLAPSA